MKTIVLALAAMTVAFAQTPAAKTAEKTAPAAVTATAKPEAKKVAKKHVKKAEATKTVAATPAPAVK